MPHASHPFRLALSAAVLAMLGCIGCDGCARDDSEQTDPALVGSSGVTRRALTPELANKVLAKVGERSITLGDYVSALERMDSFERLRYQTPERRRLLLDEMIDIELLAREAERRGLDKEPETQAYLWQLQREELLRELSQKQPKLEELPAAEVRAYYDAHRDDFRDPERRRVAVIVLSNHKLASELLEQLEDDAERWGPLATAHSQLRPATAEPRLPADLAGDLGFVTAPGVERGENTKVPEAVRRAVFEIETQGAVYPEVVNDAGQYYLVRLVAKNPERGRTFEEAQTTIRVKLLQERLRRAEEALEAELRKKYPVRIDEAALAQLKLPAAGPGRAPDGVPSVVPSEVPPPALSDRSGTSASTNPAATGSPAP